MAGRLLVISGVLLVAVTFAAWYLLTGFGCAMNTSGCDSFRLDLGRESLTIFVPFVVLGAAIAGFGVWKTRSTK